MCLRNTIPIELAIQYPNHLSCACKSGQISIALVCSLHLDHTRIAKPAYTFKHSQVRQARQRVANAFEVSIAIFRAHRHKTLPVLVDGIGGDARATEHSLTVQYQWNTALTMRSVDLANLCKAAMERLPNSFARHSGVKRLRGEQETYHFVHLDLVGWEDHWWQAA
jgi:hypothetical protein